MQHDYTVTQVRPKGPIVQEWAKNVTVPSRRVVHVYVVATDDNMYCLGCGRNIINTPWGDGAVQRGSRPLRAHEITCEHLSDVKRSLP